MWGVGEKAVSVGGAAPYTPAFVTRHALVGWRPESAISRFRDTTNGNCNKVMHHYNSPQQWEGTVMRDENDTSTQEIGFPKRGRGRPRLYDQPLAPAERAKRYRERRWDRIRATSAALARREEVEAVPDARLLELLTYALAGYDASTSSGRMHAIDIARAARELARRYDERAAAAVAEIDDWIDGRLGLRNP